MVLVDIRFKFLCLILFNLDYRNVLLESFFKDMLMLYLGDF